MRFCQMTFQKIMNGVRLQRLLAFSLCLCVSVREGSVVWSGSHGGAGTRRLASIGEINEDLIGKIMDSKIIFWAGGALPRGSCSGCL
jgi:hypothetical protein